MKGGMRLEQEEVSRRCDGQVRDRGRRAVIGKCYGVGEVLCCSSHVAMVMVHGTMSEVFYVNGK